MCVTSNRQHARNLLFKLLILFMFIPSSIPPHYALLRCAAPRLGGHGSLPGAGLT
jgi:hypothetical protein